MKYFPGIVLIVTVFHIIVYGVHGSSGDEIDSLGISTEGMRCNTCGTECTPVCGSRQFRACCLNYIKRKRGNVDSETTPQKISSFPETFYEIRESKEGIFGEFLQGYHPVAAVERRNGGKLRKILLMENDVKTGRK